MGEPRSPIAAAVVEAIRSFPEPMVAAYLFGSRATGESLPDSDYDFAVLAERPLAAAELSRLRDALRRAIPGSPEVDCVDLRRAPLTLAAQILESGLVLDCGDEYERGMVETRILSMYASLNEERGGIIDDIVARGSVYA